MTLKSKRKTKSPGKVNIGEKCFYGGVLCVFLFLLNDIEKLAAESSMNALVVLAITFIFSLFSWFKRYS